MTLTLHSLATLMHEVAHHHDNTQRVRHGRWLADRTEHNEWYAEKMEYAWVCDVVIPYLEKSYPQQVKALLDWLKQFGGLRLPLEFFVGDPRVTTRNGMTRLSCDGHTAFEGWVTELPNCPDIIASWLAFAWELHYADEYDTCLQVIEKILAKEPSHPGACECYADTLVHLERLDEAWSIASQLLDENRANRDVWKILARVHKARREWLKLLAVCDEWQGIEDPNYHSLNLYRTVAYCALCRDAEMEAELARFRLRFVNQPEDVQRRRVKAHRRLVFRHAGRKLED
ncbi:MAG: tetratricopeptide repeat protein [Chthoniobacteraceae bacterium]